MKKELESQENVLDLLTGLAEKIAILDKKLDVLIGRSGGQRHGTPQAVSPSLDLVHAHDPVPGMVRKSDQEKRRPVYQIVCAECKKESEIPFKPTGDRPVYCKECFSRRKSAKFSPASQEKNVSEAPSVPAQAPAAVSLPAEPMEIPVVEKKKASSKKTAPKKKVVAAKKKK